MIKETAEKMTQVAIPVFLGWLLTSWIPVPRPIKGMVTTAVSAVTNGFSAAVATATAPEKKPQKDSKTELN